MNSVQFQIEMIEDRTGALEEYASRRGAAPFVAVDSETIGPALRILSKHGLIRKTNSPRITCRLGDTATMMVNAKDDDEPNADHLSLQLSVRESELGMLTELHLQGSGIAPEHGINWGVCETRPDAARSGYPRDGQSRRREKRDVKLCGHHANISADAIDDPSRSSKQSLSIRRPPKG